MILQVWPGLAVGTSGFWRESWDWTWFSYFSWNYDKILNRNHLREKSFILAHSVREFSVYPFREDVAAEAWGGADPRPRQGWEPEMGTSVSKGNLYRPISAGQAPSSKIESHTLGWLTTRYVDKVDLELLIFRFWPPKCWDYKCMKPCLFSCRVGDQIQDFLQARRTLHWLTELHSSSDLIFQRLHSIELSGTSWGLRLQNMSLLGDVSDLSNTLVYCYQDNINTAIVKVTRKDTEVRGA